MLTPQEMRELRHAAANGDPAALAILMQTSAAHVGAVSPYGYTAQIGALPAFAQIGAVPAAMALAGRGVLAEAQPSVLGGFQAPGVTPADAVTTDVPMRFNGAPLGEKLALTAGQSSSVEIKPQHIYRGEKLIMVSGGAGKAEGCLITRIDIGGENVLEGTGPVHSFTFAPDAPESRIKLKDINPSLPMTVFATNLDGANAQTLYITVLGSSLR